jgi:GT2 family glycosyltransferase
MVSNIQSLTTSIVIPTYHRPNDLADCLDSILKQSTSPLEVIVVDNDSGQSAHVVVGEFEARYTAQRIALRYQASPKNSLPYARNLGVKLSQGDIVLFLDDDVTLEENYLSEILKVYHEKPTAMGVQGYVIKSSGKPRFWHWLFFLSNVKLETSQVLPSIQVVSPLKPSKVIPCECLTGLNAAYRRSILEEFPGDENLFKYSYGEDLDQSYRIFKRYPDTLWMTPFARCVHKKSPAGRAVGKEFAYVVEIYRLYLFYKLFPQTLKNKMIYWWSTFGRILLKTRLLLRGDFTPLYHIGAFFFCLRHLNEIRTGDLAFFTRNLSE